jgi:hypothetical protein
MTRSLLLNTGTEDLKEILANGKTYSVPPYQRDYSWKREHWEDLWEDLLAIERNDEDHYMGAIVLESGERKHFRVIDGQQRLATLSVLILACVDYLEALAKEGVDPSANAERASLLESSYVGAKDPTSLRVISKLRLNANDDNFFQLNLTQRKEPHGGVRGLLDSEKLLWECFDFFRAKVQQKFAPQRSGEQVTVFIGDVVAERLVFITVRVRDQLSAYTVFETLNARGLELTETDLLKNYLLSLADRLSKSQIDPVLRQWTRITDRVGIGAFPEFLRHFLNARRGYVRQKQLFRTIKADVTELKDVFALLDQLEVDAAWYEALNDPASEFWHDFPGAKEQVRVLNLFGVSQYTPLVLAAKDIFTAPQDVVRILSYCAIVSVRFNGVGRRSTHVLEEVYNRAALELRSGRISSAGGVRQCLKPIYIPDDEFEHDFTSLRLKSRGTQGKRLKYLLARLERQLSGVDISDSAMDATVEHVLPENPAASQWTEFTRDAHERSVDRLGNYALLEGSLNRREAANAEFLDKRSVYAKSKYSLSNRLCEFAEWTEDAIDRRQARLAKIASSLWAIAD